MARSRSIGSSKPPRSPEGVNTIRILILALFGLSVGLIADRVQWPFVSYDNIPEPLRPFRPTWMGAVNLAGELVVKHTNVLKCDPDAIVARAKRKTGISNLYEDSHKTFSKGLEILCDSYERESNLTALGRVIVGSQLDIWVENRLKVADHHSKLKANEAVIQRPVFVVGMPRSGTTFLHNLLNIDSETFRGPRLWEVVDPTPPLGLKGRDFERTLRTTWSMLGTSGFKHLSPSVQAVHPIHTFNAEECMPILAMSGVSLQFSVGSNTSSYNEWMLKQDPMEALSWHKKFLRVLQSGGGENDMKGLHWLLKAPFHMHHLSEILKTYPDAVIISPHRHPKDMVPSLSSLHARFYGIVTDHVDPKAIGREVLRDWDVILSRYVRARELASPADDARMLDIPSGELAKDPIRQVKRVYNLLGRTLSAKAERDMRDWLEHDRALGKKGAAGKHEYKDEWFGLDESETQRGGFKAYWDKFKDVKSSD